MEPMACWYRVTVGPDYKKQEWRGGKLLAWSTNYTEVGDRIGQSPVALVEVEKTGMVEMVEPHHICFAATPPNGG